MFEALSLRKNKVHQFRQKVEIYTEKGPFILKTAQSSKELVAALRLRYQVFHLEMLGRRNFSGIDVDQYDLICDHLLVIEKKSNQVVGTYRLNSSLNGQNFYSAQEFNLRHLLEKAGVKIELGRACIHADHRKGSVMNLLWRGIAEYMNRLDAELMFGCTSIKTESPRQAALIYRYFETQEKINQHYSSSPTENFKMPGLDLWINTLNRPLTLEEIQEVEELVPSLCRSYLKAGAWIAGEPAYDPDFQCIDFLTVLKRENLTRALWRKYSIEESPVQTENVKISVLEQQNAQTIVASF